MVPELLILALDFYRAPLRYPHLARPDQPLPESFDNLIGAFAVALSPGNIAKTAQALGTSPEVTKKASLFFLRQVLLVPGSDHYRVLGLSPGASEAAIREHYHLLVRIFHPDRSEGDPTRNADYTARINDAYSTLRKADARERYDRLRRSSLRGEWTAKADIDHFRRRQPVASNPDPVSTAAGLRAGNSRPMMLLLWGGVVAVATVAVLTIWGSSTRPVLRTNPELANASIAEPSFLRGRASIEPEASRAQRPAVSQGTIDDSIRGGTREQVPAPAAAEPIAELPAEYQFEQPLEGGATRDQFRNAAVTGLALYPTAPDGDELDAPGSKSADVSPTREEAASTLPVPSALQGPPTLAQSAITAYSKARATNGRASSLEKDGAIAVASPPVEDAFTPGSSLGHAQNPNAPALLAGSDLKSVAADAPGDEVLSTDSESASVAQTEAPGKRKNVQAAALAEKGRKKPGTPVSDTPRTRPQEQGPVVPKADRQEMVSRKLAKNVDARREPAPEKTIARLARYYRAGDVNGLVNLFTANARVTDGRGKAAIRSDYAGLFARTSDRRLSVRGMSWHRAPNGTLIGKGVYRAGTKSDPRASWRYSTGTLRIKLVPSGGEYKIAEFFY